MVKRIVAQEKPDLIMAFGPWTFITSSIAVAFGKTPIITSMRNAPKLHEKNAFRKMALMFMCTADGCIFQTREEMNYFPAILQRKSSVINNLVSQRFFNISRTANRKNIVGVGILESRKNWRMAIKAFSLIADRIEDDLLIYGTGSEKETLIEYAEELGLTQRVVFVGWSAEIEKEIAKAKLLVLSSDYEGTPNALIEALLVGLPCISTCFDGGGAKRLIESGVNGVLVPKGDHQAMAEAMLQMLTDEEYAERLGAKARERARDEFDHTRVLGQWEDYIVSVFERCKGRC
jgi:glycosyltransferase involved in cell wall biosynthesis